MAKTIGTAYIQIEPSFQGVPSTISKELGDVGDSAGKSFGSKFATVAGTAAKAGVAAIGAASAAVTAFGTDAVRTGAEFDAAMSQVAATSGKTVDEIQNLRDFAQQMGSTTSFSATQAAEALNYMALAGYDADKSMEMLPNVLNLAAAGGIDLAYASDMVTDAASALGLTTEETATMVDQMAMAASKSNTSVSQLGEALLTIGATAANVKGGTNELSTVLGALADNGIKGAEGGTHLRNILLSLQNAAEDGAVNFGDFSVSVYDADGNMRSMIDIIGEMQEGMDGMSQASKDALTSGVFNKTDLASVNALLNTTDERFVELQTAIGNADGAAKQMADTQLDNLAGDITLFQSALEGAKIAVSDALTPSIREFVQFGSEGLSKLTTAFQEGGLSGAMESLGDILTEGLSKLLDKVPDLIDAGAQLVGALFTGLVENAPKLADAVVEIVGKFSEKLTDGEAINEFVSGITSVVETVANMLGEIVPILLPALIQGILSLVQALLQNLSTILDSILNLIIIVAETILKEGLPMLLEMLPDLIVGIVEFIVSSIPTIINAVITIILAIVDAFPTIIEKLVDAIPQIIVGIVTALLSAIPELISAGIRLFLALITELPKIIVEIVKAIPQIIVGIVEAFKEAWPEIKQAGLELLVMLIKGLTNIGTKISDGVKKVWNALKEKFTEMSVNAVKWGADMLTNFIEGIKSKISAVTDAVKNVAETVKDFLGFSEPKEGPLSNFHTYAPDMMDLFAKGITDNEDMLKATVSEAFDFQGSIEKNYEAPESNGNYEEAVLSLLGTIADRCGVQLDVNSDGLFNVIRTKNSEYSKMTGRSAFA